VSKINFRWKFFGCQKLNRIEMRKVTPWFRLLTLRSYSWRGQNYLRYCKFWRTQISMENGGLFWSLKICLSLFFENYWKIGSKLALDCHLNFHFRPKFRFLFSIKFWFLSKFSIFTQNVYFWPKFGFMDEILIFGQIFNFCLLVEFWFLSKVQIFHSNFNFWRKF